MHVSILNNNEDIGWLYIYSQQVIGSDHLTTGPVDILSNVFPWITHSSHCSVFWQPTVASRLIKSGGCLSRGPGARLWRTRTGTTALLLSQQQQRHYGKIGNYIHVERDSENREVAVVQMRRQPVNGLNADFMVELEETLNVLQNDNSYRGIILSSGNPDVFSAGLDIPNLYQKSSSHFSELWKSLLDF